MLAIWPVVIFLTGSNSTLFVFMMVKNKRLKVEVTSFFMETTIQSLGYLGMPCKEDQRITCQLEVHVVP